MRCERSIIEFTGRVQTHIKERRLHEALIAIQQLVDQIFCEPLNTAQILSSPVLDAICQEIGKASLAELKLTQVASVKPKAVYIASRLQASGGHTAVLADMIRFSPLKEHIVLLTGTVGATDAEAIRQRFSVIENITFETAPHGNHAEKLQWLQKRLHELSPSDVWLFNHHQDSVAIAAVQPQQGYRLHFYHHGDHHICLGVHLDYADHIDPHPIILHYCQDTLKLPNSRYLPMVVADKGMRKDVPFKVGGTLRTCMAAGYNKIEIPYFISYAEVVPKLLKASGGSHLHIGRLTPWMLFRIRCNLKKHGIDASRFQHIRYVPSVWGALQQHQIDVYVASFPQGGGRTLIEAMGAGIPVAVHDHPGGRMLGGTDMAYNGACFWRDPETLYDFLRRADQETLKSHSLAARKRYEEHHQERLLQKALSDPDFQTKVPSLHSFSPDALQQAMYRCNNLKLHNILMKQLKRFIRGRRMR